MPSRRTIFPTPQPPRGPVAAATMMESRSLPACMMAAHFCKSSKLARHNLLLNSTSSTSAADSTSAAAKRPASAASEESLQRRTQCRKPDSVEDDVEEASPIAQAPGAHEATAAAAAAEIAAAKPPPQSRSSASATARCASRAGSSKPSSMRPLRNFTSAVAASTDRQPRCSNRQQALVTNCRAALLAVGGCEDKSVAKRRATSCTSSREEQPLRASINSRGPLTAAEGDEGVVSLSGFASSVAAAGSARARRQ
mmetsp:Transcript_707/g.2918  ORF Transcript_707/g.2918 Transcript_707/m.2918 type:complete len:254 (-) Transcript_707:379-1140(-)